MQLTTSGKRRRVTTIEVADMAVEVERKWIKNLYLRISSTDACIRVSAPMMMSEEAIRQFVLSKEAWIRQRMKKVGEKKQSAPREYVSGEIHYYKGHKYRLEVVYHNGPARVKIEGSEYIILYVREGASKERREEVLREWYRAEFKAMLPSLIEKWENTIGVKASRWEVKQMKTLWGSCNHRTRKITFNLELMKKTLHCIEYVVVHELLHIIVRLHNEEFKSLLTHYLPNWKQTKEELNKFTV